MPGWPPEARSTAASRAQFQRKGQPTTDLHTHTADGSECARAPARPAAAACRARFARLSREALAARLRLSSSSRNVTVANRLTVDGSHGRPGDDQTPLTSGAQLRCKGPSGRKGRTSATGPRVSCCKQRWYRPAVARRSLWLTCGARCGSNPAWIATTTTRVAEKAPSTCAARHKHTTRHRRLQTLTRERLTASPPP